MRSFRWLDGSTSSARFLTPARNNVSNNLWFASAYHAELRVSGRIADWLSIEAVFRLSRFASLNLQFDSGTWDVRTALSVAIGYPSQGDLVGLVLMLFTT